MPTATMTAIRTTGLNDIPKWNTPAVTQKELEWADILTVDLSIFPSRKSELVQTVATALQRDGFFYVVGHGIEPERVSVPPHL